MNQMSIKNLTLTLGQKTLLHNINIELKREQSIVIIGESGSGKTVLSKLLIGQILDNAKISGEILFENKNLLELDKKSWQKYRGDVISYIAQNPMAIFNQMQTIKSHAIEFFSSKLKISKSECISKMISALQNVNLQTPEQIIKKYPFQLSGGMLQRIMFAMMLELNPEIIIADEPTSALDSYNTNTVIELLQKFKEKKSSMIIITHDYKLLKSLADYIIIMKDGNIIEQGEASKLLDNPQTEYAKELLSPKKYVRYGVNDEHN